LLRPPILFKGPCAASRVRPFSLITFIGPYLRSALETRPEKRMGARGTSPSHFMPVRLRALPFAYAPPRLAFCLCASAHGEGQVPRILPFSNAVRRSACQVDYAQEWKAVVRLRFQRPLTSRRFRPPPSPCGGGPGD